MHSGAFQKNLKVCCLILTSLACATVARAQITLTLDLKAGDATTTLDSGNTGHVQVWQDSSGSGLDVSTSTQSQEPLLVDNALNGQAVLRFDGSDILQRSSVLGSTLVDATHGTMMFVITPSTPSGQAGQAPILWSESSGPTSLIGYTDGPNSGALRNVYGAQSSGDFIEAAQPSGWYGNSHVITMVRDGNVGSIRVDGVTIADNVSFTGSLNTGSSGNIFVGAANSGGFLGDMAELRIYNGALDSSQISSVESSLATTYGLSLVPEPSQYAMVFSLACLVGAVCYRRRVGVRA